MTIHPDIHRAILQHGGNLQDAIRETWMASIPPAFRKCGTEGSTVLQSPLERGTETTQARAAAARAELAKVILPLHHKGTYVPQLALAAKCSHATVRRVLIENGHEPHVSPRGGVKHRDWASYVPQAMELRQKGMTWRKVGKALGVCSNRLAAACKAQEGRA